MTEGTRSYLFGCHHFLMHPIQDIRGWWYEHGRWPCWWEIIAIFCHDIGVCGRQYLSVPGAKAGHWRKGANLARRIVRDVYRVKAWLLRRHRYTLSRLMARAYGEEAYRLVAGHCPEESGYPRSNLFRPDKRCWVIAPMWWLWSNYYVEWCGKNVGVTPPPVWKELCRKNLETENPIGNHELYEKHKK